MTQDKHQFEELAAPKTVARTLNISVATLRKYSLIVEKVTGNKNHFQRNGQKARLYSKKDIADLQAFHKLSKNHKLTLEEAARQIYAVSNKSQRNPDLSAAKEESGGALVDPKQFGQLLVALQKTIAGQNKAISALQSQLSQISKQNEKLLQNQKRIEAPKKDNSDKIAAMPDISGIVTKGATKEADTKPQTPAEKRATVKADKQKTREQVRREILSKSKENAQKHKASANVHRTLSDMQLPAKKHWWQRFLNM